MLALFHHDCLIQLESCRVALQYFGLLIYFAIHKHAICSVSSNSENEPFLEDSVIAQRFLDCSDMFNINITLSNVFLLKFLGKNKSRNKCKQSIEL